MLDIVQTTQFKKDVKRCRKRGWDMSGLATAIGLLQNEEELPAEYKVHPLVGDRRGQMDLHIKGDWILLYRIENELELLRLERTGTHSDLNI
jgi:mRNA interferase YafQ